MSAEGMRRELLSIAAEMAETRARLVATLAMLDGDAPPVPAWTPVRDPETGQRLFDWHPSGRMRFVTKWHGERREVILPLPSVA